MADNIGRVQLDIEIPQRAVDREAAKAGNTVQRVLTSSLQSTQRAMTNMFTSLSRGARASTSGMSAAAENLSNKLENINAQIDIQKQKLARLREQYGYLTEVGRGDSDRGLKMQDQIAKTEAAIIRLTQASDKTAQALWKIDDAMGKTGDTSEKTAAIVEKSGHKMAKGIDTATKSVDTFNKGVFNMASQVTAALKRVLRRVLLFGVLYKVVRGFITYVTDALKTNEEFNKSLGTLRTSLKVAFQPIVQAAIPAITALVRTLATATTYVASFISGLFGKSYKDSLKSVQHMEAAKEAMKGYGKAAKEARRSLLGIDEIHIVGAETGAAAGGEAPEEMVIPDNLDGIEAKTSRVTGLIRQAFQNLLKWLKNAWRQGGKDMFAPIGKAFKDMWQNTIKPMAKFAIFDYFAPIGESALRNLVPIFAETIPWAFDEAGKHFQWLGDQMNTIWENVIKPVYELIRDVVTGTLDIIGQLWDEHGQNLLTNLSGYMDSIREVWDTLWTEILEPIIKPFLEFLRDIWNNSLKDIVKDVGGFILELINAALVFYNNVIAPIIKWLIKILAPQIENAFDTIKDIIETIVGTISDKISSIKKTLNGIIDFITGIFTGDWKRAWNGLKGIATGAFDGMWSGVKGVINLLITGVNGMIRGLNKISFKIPNWSIFGDWAGKNFGLNIPLIPKLAKGGLIDQPTLAMIGENRRKEAVLPLEQNPGNWAGLVANEIAKRLPGGGGQSGDMIVQVYVGRKKLHEEYISEAMRKNARAGKVVVPVGV